MSSRTSSSLIFFGAFTILIFALHLPYVQLPFYWDELGQFVPAALDILRLNAWIPVNTTPNVHPPGVMAYLALVWTVFGYSVLATRLAMLLIASIGALLAFLLAIRLARGTSGAPAFAAILFLLATPLFYTQAMMAQLDMPAMVLTTLALLLFLDQRYAASAVTCVALVLVKETALSTPLVFAAWLWISGKNPRRALWFLAPCAALALWMLALYDSTGNLFGNVEFERYNLSDSLQPAHILATLLRRLYYLFIADGRFVGTLAMITGLRVLRTREWRIAFLVAGAQILVVSFLGGAALERYLLPVFPILYAAMSCSASIYPSSWRWISQITMAAALVIGYFWYPPYPFPFENNLAMTDFVDLQKDAAFYVEATAPGKRIATAWPFTDALDHPDLGYVSHPLNITRLEDFSFGHLADLDRHKTDMLIVYSRTYEGPLLDYEPVRSYLRRYWNYEPQATTEQIRHGLGFVPVAHWTRRNQWIEIYVPEH